MNKRQRKKQDKKDYALKQTGLWNTKHPRCVVLRGGRGPSHHIQYIHNWDEFTDCFGHPTPSCMTEPNKFASLHKRLKQLCEESGIKVILPTANYAVPNRNGRSYESGILDNIEYFQGLIVEQMSVPKHMLTPRMEKVRSTPPTNSGSHAFKFYDENHAKDITATGKKLIDENPFPLMTVREDLDERMVESDEWEAKQRAREERNSIKSGMIRQSNEGY